jgi:DNA-binding transcriptional ArsR family regulator
MGTPRRAMLRARFAPMTASPVTPIWLIAPDPNEMGLRAAERAIPVTTSEAFGCGNDAVPRDPFNALGDPNRRAIVELLRSGDRSVQELADALPISRPAVSRHLKLLKDAGLVADHAEGTRRLYRLHEEGVEAVREYLQQVWGEAAARFKLTAENSTMEPLELQFTVDCSPEHAFVTWARREAKPVTSPQGEAAARAGRRAIPSPPTRA